MAAEAVTAAAAVEAGAVAAAALTAAVEAADAAAAAAVGAAEEARAAAQATRKESVAYVEELEQRLSAVDAASAAAGAAEGAAAATKSVGDGSDQERAASAPATADAGANIETELASLHDECTAARAEAAAAKEEAATATAAAAANGGGEDLAGSVGGSSADSSANGGKKAPRKGRREREWERLRQAAPGEGNTLNPNPNLLTLIPKPIGEGSSPHSLHGGGGGGGGGGVLSEQAFYSGDMDVDVSAMVTARVRDVLGAVFSTVSGGMEAEAGADTRPLFSST